MILLAISSASAFFAVMVVRKRNMYYEIANRESYSIVDYGKALTLVSLRDSVLNGLYFTFIFACYVANPHASIKPIKHCNSYI